MSNSSVLALSLFSLYVCMKIEEYTLLVVRVNQVQIIFDIFVLSFALKMDDARKLKHFALNSMK